MRVENEVVALMAFGAIAIGVGAWGVLRPEEPASIQPASVANDVVDVMAHCIDANALCRHQLTQCAADREQLLAELRGGCP